MFAGLTSAVALAAFGRLDGTTAAGPLNGPSQWLWGERAAHSRRWSWQHTAVGFVIHQLSAVGWAAMHVGYLAGPRRGENVADTLVRAAATATLAATVDYRLTPRRLQPGYEKQLSIPSMVGVYAAFGLGMAVADFVAASRRKRGSGRSRG